MKRFALALLLALPLYGSPKDYSGALRHPASPSPRVIEAEPPLAAQTVHTFCAQDLTCAWTAAHTFSASVSLNGGGALNGSVSGAPALRGTTTATNINSRIICDGTKYTTIQAAAAALPASGGEVEVPSASACTWNGAGLTGNVTIRFMNAAATYAMSGAIVITNANNHIICAGTQSPGQSGTNFYTIFGGTTLDWTNSSISGTTDLISAIGGTYSGTVNVDGLTIENCYIKAGAKGRDAIHLSAINGSRIENVVIYNAGRDGYWLDSGTTSGGHSYGNSLTRVDVLHAARIGYHFITAQATGTNDIDRTVLNDAEYHGRSGIDGASSGTSGFTLEVPSGAVQNNVISNMIFIDCQVAGLVSGSNGVNFIVSQAGLNSSISAIVWMNGEIEDTYITQPNTNFGIAATDTAQTDLVGIWLKPSYSAGWNNPTNLSQLNSQLSYYIGTGTTEANTQNLFDILSFQNTTVATPGLSSGGIRFFFPSARYILSPTDDAQIHFYRSDTAVNQWSIDTGKQRIIPRTPNWKIGDHTAGTWQESSFYNYYAQETTAPSTASGYTALYADSTSHTLKSSYNNGSFLNVPQVVANGTSTMTSGAITAATCQAAITTAAAGVATTDSIEWAYATAPTLTTDALLHISPYVTSGNVNFTRCNPTNGSITGTAIVINWRVIR